MLFGGVTGSRGEMALELAGRSLLVLLAWVNDCVDTVRLALNALFCWNVLAVVVFLNDYLRRVSAQFRD